MWYKASRNIIKHKLPVQLIPVPLYPGLQVQLYHPIVFLQFASFWHLCIPVSHSSMSRNKKAIQLIAFKEMQLKRIGHFIPLCPIIHMGGLWEYEKCNKDFKWVNLTSTVESCSLISSIATAIVSSNRVYTMCILTAVVAVGGVAFINI